MPTRSPQAELKQAATTDMMDYRTTLKAGTLEKAHDASLETRVQERLELTSFGINEEPVQVFYDIRISGVGRAYVEVTVTQKTEFFLSGVLEALGISDESMQFSATAYAECVDLMGYTSIVNLSQYITGSLSSYQSIGALYNSWDELWGSVRKLLGY